VFWIPWFSFQFCSSVFMYMKSWSPVLWNPMILCYMLSWYSFLACLWLVEVCSSVFYSSSFFIIYSLPFPSFIHFIDHILWNRDFQAFISVIIHSLRVSNTYFIKSVENFLLRSNQSKLNRLMKYYVNFSLSISGEICQKLIWSLTMLTTALWKLHDLYFPKLI